MADDDTKHTVGYRKPPKSTRFKPGQSGNPTGRPRKVTNFLDDLETEMRCTVNVLEDGKTRRRLSKGRAIVKLLFNLALSGDIRAAELLLKVMRAGHFDQPDKIDALLDEFREKNRRLQARNEIETGTSSSVTDSTPSNTKGEKA